MSVDSTRSAKGPWMPRCRKTFTMIIVELMEMAAPAKTLSRPPQPRNRPAR